MNVDSKHHHIKNVISQTLVFRKNIKSIIHASG
jgi:hypothetical protein